MTLGKAAHMTTVYFTPQFAAVAMCVSGGYNIIRKRFVAHQAVAVVVALE